MKPRMRGITSDGLVLYHLPRLGPVVDARLHVASVLGLNEALRQLRERELAYRALAVSLQPLSARVAGFTTVKPGVLGVAWEQVAFIPAALSQLK